MAELRCVFVLAAIAAGAVGLAVVGAVSLLVALLPLI
jgi:hypothetical protein